MSVHVFSCFLSRCTIATHLACHLLRMPWSTLTHISSLESVLWLDFSPVSTKHALTDTAVRVNSEKKQSFACSNAPLCTLMKNHVFVFFSWLRVLSGLFSKGNCSFWVQETEQGKQADRLRGGMLRIPATPCSVYIICVTDELWMRL